jgi:hypothetical protein
VRAAAASVASIIACECARVEDVPPSSWDPFVSRSSPPVTGADVLSVTLSHRPPSGASALLLLLLLPSSFPLHPSHRATSQQVRMDAWEDGVPATALREISVLKEVRGRDGSDGERARGGP